MLHEVTVLLGYFTDPLLDYLNLIIIIIDFFGVCACVCVSGGRAILWTCHCD